MLKIKTFTLLCIIQILCFNQAVAQNDNPDFMQSIGKIYVVVAVIIIAFIGILLFLFSLEKKIKHLEDQLGNH